MMKKTTIVKAIGWAGMALLGVAVNWATDKEAKEEVDKKVSELIEKKNEGD